MTARPSALDRNDAATLRPLGRRLAAETLGTGYLLAAVVGSGIFAQRLASNDAAFVLLVSAVTTATALFALIQRLAPISGAHLNPLVTVALAWRGELSRGDALAYAMAQTTGAMAAVAVVHATFDLPAFSLAQTARYGPSQWLAESVASFGLLALVLSCSRRNPTALPTAVSAFVGAAFWFTPTDFVNPALTLARALTDSFAGIRPADVPGFVLAQAVGGIAACGFDRWLSDGAA